MSNITLNTDYLLDKNLSINDFLEILEYKDLIRRIRYIDSVGKPWGEWDRTCQLLEEKAKLLNFCNFEQFSKLDNINSRFNFLYIFMDFSKNNPNIVLETISKLPNPMRIQLLSKNDIAASIINKLLDDFNVMDNLSSQLLLLIIIRLNTLRYDRDIERKILEYLKSKYFDKWNNPIDQLAREALNIRLDNLFSLFNNQVSSGKKVAVFITGQSRNFEESINSIKLALKNIKYDCDIYISTWKFVGGNIVDENRLLRYLQLKDVRYLNGMGLSNKDIVDLINKYYKKNKALNVSDALFREHLNDCSKNININIKDDFEFPYNEMSNPEKMYYHNSFWIRTLGREYFLEKYTYILKIRPDINIDLDFINDFNLEENQIITEDMNGWMFREWGVGIGDQIIYGRTLAMIHILNVYKSNKIVEDLCVNIFNKSNYEGHMNIGILAWLNGYDVLPNNVFNHKLINNPKLQIKDLGI